MFGEDDLPGTVLDEDDLPEAVCGEDFLLGAVLGEERERGSRKLNISMEDLETFSDESSG